MARWSLLAALLAVVTLEAQEVRAPLWMRAARSGGPAALSITQDTAGFVWLGTTRGLVRTDGREYRDLRLSGTARVVSTLLTDREGRIWVGTSAGLDRLDPATGEVERYRHDPDDPRSLSGDAVSVVFEDDAGRIWVGALDWASEGGGLNLFEPATGSFRRFLHDPLDAGTLSHDRVRTIAQTADGTIWVGTWNGLNQLDPESGRIRRWHHDPEEPGSLAYDDVKALIPTRDGRIWVGTLGGGLDRLDPRTGEFEHHRHVRGDPASIPSDYVMALTRDALGRLWIGTLDGGLALLDTVDGSLRRVDPPAEGIDGGQLERVEALYVTEDDVVWISGFDPELNTALVATVDVRAPRVEILETGTPALALEEEPDGVVWTLLAGGRLLRWDRRTGAVVETRCGTPSPERPLAVDGDLVASPDGSVWVGTWGGGLCRVPPGGGTARPVTPPPGVRAPEWISSLVRDGAGEIWVGHVEGLSVLDPRTGRVRDAPFPIPDGGAELVGGLPDGDELWIRTAEALLRLDPDGSGPEPYVLWSEYPALTAIRWAARDTAGSVWAASELAGLCRLAPDGPRCRSAGAGDPLDGARGVYADRRGRLWVTTAFSLVEHRPGTGESRPMPLPLRPGSRFFQAASGLVGAGGDIHLGGGGHVLVFDPDEMAGNPIPPRIRIVAVETGGQRGSGPDSVAFPSVPRTDSIRLPHGRNDLTFRYAGLHYARPDLVRYEHRLVGFEEEYHDGGTTGEATYTNLRPGVYEFRVRARTASGVVSAEEAVVDFRIAAPWWANRWAYAVYILLGAGLLYWYVRVVQYRARLAARLEIKSAEATRLQDLDDAKSRFFANISHEFRTPLTLILGQLRSVLDDPGREGNEDRLRMAERSAERVGRMVDQILDLSKLEAGTVKLEGRVGDVVPLVRLRVASFQSVAESRGVGLSLAVQQAPIRVRHDPEKVEMIVDNLLSNALKFTRPGDSVRVTLRVVDRTLDPAPLMELEVIDSGVGIPAEHLGRIFDRFYRVEGPDRPEGPGAGIGLALTRELVDLHGGDIDVASEPGRGTRFTVRLPLADPEDEPAGEEAASGGVVAAPSPAGEGRGEPDGEDGERDGADADREDAETGELESDGDDRPLVLIVEDNADLRTFLRDHLEEEYRLLEASDGEAGLALALDSIPDLILTDVMMPRMDGYELSRHLRADERTSHVPIVMLTAKASESSRIEGLGIGVDDYLLKPFSRSVLLTRIRNLIELRRILREKYSGETWIRPGEVEVASVDRVFLRKVTAAIEEHLGDGSFGVEQLASAVHMSSSQLNRKLRALIDQTPGRLIRGMRVHRAAELIRKDAGNLSRIAFLSGFSDHAHLSRTFKKQFGCTPSEYRDRGPSAPG